MTDGLLDKVWNGARITASDALELYKLPLEELGALADRRRQLKKGEAYNGRGNAWSKKGDGARALADYNEAIRLNPKFAMAYENRGLAWSKKPALTVVEQFKKFALANARIN